MATVKKETIKKESKVSKETKTATPVIARSKTTKQSSGSKNKIATNSSSSRNDDMKSTLKVSVMDVEGKTAGSMTLPENIFGAKVNPTLMAQAVRVYLANQRQGNAKTKTRGEVDGSTRKIYRQKGTGRARHGGVRAPIFVKGGTAHGPKLRDYSLTLPAKMKRAALFSALTTQLENGNIIVVSGMEVAKKTKSMAQTLTKLGVANPKAKVRQVKVLIVMPSVLESVYQAGRNIKAVALTPASMLSTYDVLEAGKIVVMKDAVEAIEKTFIKPVRQAQGK